MSANTAVLAGYAGFETVVVFLFTVLLARYLGASDFGRLNFALNYALLFSIWSDPGISIAMTKLVATAEPGHQSRLVANGFALRLALSAVVFLCSLVPLGFSAYMRGAAWLIVTIAVSEHLRNLAIYLCAVFRGHQQNKYEALSLGVERISCLAVGWVLLHLGFRTFTVALLYLGARLASLAVALIIYSRRFGWTALHFDREVVDTIRLQSYPLALLMICERANMSLPPLLVTYFAGERENGIFAAAFKAVMPAVLLSTAVAGSLYAPMAARFLSDPAESARLYRAGVRGLLHLLLPAAAITLMLPRQLALALYGAEYAAAAPVLQLLTLYFLSIVFVAVNHLFMPAIERQRVVGVVAVVSVVLNIALGTALIRGWGATGAAWAMGAAQFVVAAVYYTLAHRYGGAALSWREWRTLGLSFGAGLLGVGFVRGHLPSAPLAALIAGSALCAGLYAAMLALQGGISAEERHAVRRLTRKLLPRAA